MTHRIPAKIRAAVQERAQSCCEACGVFVYPAHVHHRKMLSQGGQDTVENLLWLDFRCHDRIHNNKERDSYDRGLLVSAYADPAEIEVIPW